MAGNLALSGIFPEFSPGLPLLDFRRTKDVAAPLLACGGGLGIGSLFTESEMARSTQRGRIHNLLFKIRLWVTFRIPGFAKLSAGLRVSRH